MSWPIIMLASDAIVEPAVLVGGEVQSIFYLSGLGPVTGLAFLLLAIGVDLLQRV